MGFFSCARKEKKGEDKYDQYKACIQEDGEVYYEEFNLSLSELDPSLHKKFIESLDKARIIDLVLDLFPFCTEKYSKKLDSPFCIKNILTILQRNPYIEKLTLGPNFTEVFTLKYAHSVTPNLFGCLLNMRNLTKLHLDNSIWPTHFYANLQGFLSDPNCKIKLLSLSNGITAQEALELKTIFSMSPSLLQYEGPGKEFLQKTLDDKTQRKFAAKKPAINTSIFEDFSEKNEPAMIPASSVNQV